LQSHHKRMSASLIAFTSPLVVYILTLAREVTFVDGGELPAVAATLGIAHPPGYPLFTLIGHLFSKIPVASIAFRVGLLSAVSTALASLLIYRIGERLLRTETESPAGSTARTMAPLAGALLFAFARTPWSQSSMVEVYPLQTLLALLFLDACRRGLARSGDAVRHWPWAAFTFSLGLTHHLTAVLLLPGFLVLLVCSLVDRFHADPRPRLPVGRTVTALVAPLLLYLYLPIRSSMDPIINWNYPETLQRFLVHVTARQYHGNLGREGLRLEELKRFLTEQLPQEATWLFVALAVIGLVVLARRTWRFTLVTLLSLAAYLVYNMAYPIHDIRVYYMPALAIGALWAAVGAGSLVRLATRGHWLLAAVVTLLLCHSPLLLWHRHWNDVDQSDFRLLAHSLHDSFRYLDTNAVVFSGHWDEFSSPALYVQTVEGVRPDVAVIDVGSMAGSEFYRRLSKSAPAVAEASREEILAMREIARRAEIGESYDVPAARSLYRTMIRTVIREAVGHRPCYITPDLKRHPEMRAYHVHPEGLVYRLSRKEDFLPFALPDFEGPGMTKGEVRTPQEGDVLAKYEGMMRERYLYLKKHGRDEEGEAFNEMANEYSRP